jgi:hypothetical protein
MWLSTLWRRWWSEDTLCPGTRRSPQQKEVVQFQMVYNIFSLDSVPAYLVVKIPEISFLLSTVVIAFASDYIMEYFLKKGLKKMKFVTRTIIFLFYGLIILPALCTACALFLQNAVLYPYQRWIVPVLLAAFLFVGILLSIRYNMKFKL